MSLEIDDRRAARARLDGDLLLLACDQLGGRLSTLALYGIGFNQPVRFRGSVWASPCSSRRRTLVVVARRLDA